jgi:hypothetical protein
MKAPSDTKRALFRLISFVGLRQVRDVARQLVEVERTPLNAELQRMIHEAAMFKIFGADK